MENLKQFTEKVLKGVNEKVGNEFRVSITESMKNNGNKLIGISAVPYGGIGGPCVYLDSYYKEYENGGVTFPEIVDGVYSQIMGHKDDIGDFNAACLLDWDVARNHIHAKLVSAGRNQEMLKTVPHRIFLDLAVVYYIAVSGIGGQGDGIGTIAVKDCYLPKWGQDEEGLYQSARENMRSEGKPVFEDLGAILRGCIPEGIGLGGKKETPLGTGMYILTNNRKYYGASEILDKNTLAEISDKISGDFVILPSSIHEVIVLPLNYGMDYRGLADIVKEINGTVVSPDEYLSDNVYVYVTSERTLKLAA